MTEVITRSPLQTLSMSASQRPPRRKSARNATFDEEDTRPAKRAKTTADTSTGSTKQANGRKGAGAKKAKASYDEDADGFQFTRAKARKTNPRDAVPVAESEASAPAPPQIEAQPALRPGRRKKPITDAHPVPAPNDDGTASVKRRSARLSGGRDIITQEAGLDHQNEAPTSVPASAPVPKSRKKRDRTPAVEEPELRVEKKREPSKIPLPFADTPVITRNKEMRKHSAEGHRRSSSSMRGRRASSLIDSGTSNAMPHSEVQTEDFYKHINQELPEPRRMQQLLSWCGTRVLPPKPTGGAGDVNAILAARVVQEELLRDFSKKSELSDWFNREDVAPTVLVKKPNPRNIQNAAKLEELEREVKRLSEEKQSWKKVLSTLKASSSSHDKAMEELAASGSKGLQSGLLRDSEQEEIASKLLAHGSTTEDAPMHLKQATKSLEFKLDLVADGVHKLQKLKESADGVVDAILNNASSALELRDKAALDKAGMQKVGVGDILRSISRA